MNKQPKQLPTLPDSQELALDVKSVIHALPSDAMHNHLHQFGQQANNQAHLLQSYSVAAVILTGLELQAIKIELGFNEKGGRPKETASHETRFPTWTSWVKDNCDFNKDTAARYIRAAKMAGAGELPHVPADFLPDDRPSAIGRDELTDVIGGIAESWRTNGEGGVRQLYLTLEAIGREQRDQRLIDGRNTKGGPTKASRFAGMSEAEITEMRKGAAHEVTEKLLKSLGDLRREAIYAEMAKDHREVLAEQLEDFAKQLRTLKD